MIKRILNLGNLLSFLLPPLVIWGGHFTYLYVHESISYLFSALYFCFAGLGCMVIFYKRDRDKLPGIFTHGLLAIFGVILFQPLYFLAVNNVFEFQIHTASYELIRQYLSMPLSNMRISVLDGTLFALPLLLPVMYLSGLWIRSRQLKNNGRHMKFSILHVAVFGLLMAAYLGGVCFLIMGAGGPEVRVLSNYENPKVNFDWGYIYAGVLDNDGYVSIVETPSDGEESPVITDHLAGVIFIFDLNDIKDGRVSVSNLRLFEADSGEEIILEKGQLNPDVVVEKNYYNYENMSANGVYNLDFKERGHITLTLWDVFPANAQDIELRYNFSIDSEEFKTEQEVTATAKKGASRYMRASAAFTVYCNWSNDECKLRKK